jgi:hypothetical protein
MIRALQWGLQWTFIAFCGAIVLGFSFDGRLELLEQPARTMARTGTLLVAVALATPLFFALEYWLAGAAWVRRQYPRGSIGRAILVLSSAALAVVLLYSWFGVWVLRLAWRTFDRWSLLVPGETWSPPQPDWKYALVLTAVTIPAAYFVVRYAHGTIHNYKRSLHGLGFRRFLRGIPLMILLRLRQPRRDFFMLTPVLGELPFYALAAGLAAAIPIPVFAVALPSLIVAFVAIMMLDKLRPPTLLFLGASELDSFRIFYNLRQIWGPTAFTLLDRENEGGRQFYDFQRAEWSRERRMSAGLFYDPTVPRVWSLRTRPKLWGSTVLMLMDYAPAIVVDLRFPSQAVWHEVRALTDRALIGKTLFLIDADGPNPALADALPPDARLVNEVDLAAHSYAGV